jgi:hypothetical protein
VAFALIGDAANLVDSITGEGIHYAIDSAAVLSDALHEAGPREAHRLYRAPTIPGSSTACSVWPTGAAACAASSPTS